MIIGSLIFRRPNQINDVKRIENFSTSNTTMCECPFFLEVNLIADIQCLFNDRLESHSVQHKLRYGHQFFRIFKSFLLEDIKLFANQVGDTKSCLYGCEV